MVVHHHAALPAVPQDRDVWFGVNPCTEVARGRPGSDQVTRAYRGFECQMVSDYS